MLAVIGNVSCCAEIVKNVFAGNRSRGCQSIRRDIAARIDNARVNPTDGREVSTIQRDRNYRPTKVARVVISIGRGKRSEQVDAPNLIS